MRDDTVCQNVRVAERRKGLNWVDGVLLLVVSVLVLDAVLLEGFASPLPFVASLVVLVTSLIAVWFVCKGKDVYRWAVRYMTAFLFAMLFGMVSFTAKLFEVPRWAELPVLLLVASLPVFISLTKSERGSEYRWLAFAMCLGLMVAMFSGSAGAGDTMIAWLQDRFGWTLEQAQVSTRVFRKTMHMTFYALMFLSMARAAWLARGKWSVSLLAGLVWATGHAAFDETVQSFYEDRTASFNDYLTDAGGMGIALVLCWLLWGRRGRAVSRA